MRQLDDRLPANNAKTLSFFGTSPPSSIDFAGFAPIFRSSAAGSHPIPEKLTAGRR
ncbi:MULTISPECIES: hypothetical protein [unclassified Bradyrhizobium]|uniref:hypothetical protein n=1 Tax=Bradyrhizobium TaxID=374 RepID=UPI0028EF2EE5|nr:MULTISPECIES: hypothetical protein [unclassified Bradyrhizobium]